MSKPLKDLRDSIETIEQADAVFERIARCEIQLADAAASFESKVAQLKKIYDEATAFTINERDASVKRLAAYVESRRMQFQKPRRRKTMWGTYGLTDATKAKIINKDEAIAHCISNDWNDCLKKTIKLLTKPLRDRLQAGEACPGARLLTGDVAGYTVKKELLEKAKEI